MGIRTMHLPSIPVDMPPPEGRRNWDRNKQIYNIVCVNVHQNLSEIARQFNMSLSCLAGVMYRTGSDVRAYRRLNGIHPYAEYYTY